VGLGTHDVYANLAGGIAVSDPGLDLPVAIALASTLRDRPVRPGTVAFGEVGLLGELRAVGGTERRLREAARLGFTRAVVPRTRSLALQVPGLDVVAAGNVRDALIAALDGTGSG
jgi:DNA repair protein RadA/Sms